MADFAETLARENYPNSKTWKLEVLATGKYNGNTSNKTIATGEGAISIGDRILDFLKTQEPAPLLLKRTKQTMRLGRQLVQRVEDELNKV